VRVRVGVRVRVTARVTVKVRVRVRVRVREWVRVRVRVRVRGRVRGRAAHLTVRPVPLGEHAAQRLRAGRVDGSEPAERAPQLGGQRRAR